MNSQIWNSDIVNDGQRPLLIMPDTPENNLLSGQRILDDDRRRICVPLQLRAGVWLTDARDSREQDVQFTETAAIIELQCALQKPDFIILARILCTNSASGSVLPIRALVFEEARRHLLGVFVSALRRGEVNVVGRGLDGTDRYGERKTGQLLPGDSALAIIRKQDIKRGDQPLASAIAVRSLNNLFSDSSLQKKAFELLNRPDNSAVSKMGALRRAFEIGDLLLVRISRGAPSGGAVQNGTENPEQKTALTPPAPKTARSTTAASTRAAMVTKTYIEIRLVYEDTQQPAAGAKYRLKLTDGSVREGTLDSEGKARVVGIDPGHCVVTFPDLDSREWHPA